MSEEIIGDALDKLRGAVTIVYPMNLPPYDPIRLEFEGKEELSGTQVNKLYSVRPNAYKVWDGSFLWLSHSLENSLSATLFCCCLSSIVAVQVEI